MPAAGAVQGTAHVCAQRHSVNELQHQGQGASPLVDEAGAVEEDQVRVPQVTEPALVNRALQHVYSLALVSPVLRGMVRLLRADSFM